jgi:hypothetical protein
MLANKIRPFLHFVQPVSNIQGWTGVDILYFSSLSAPKGPTLLTELPAKSYTLYSGRSAYPPKVTGCSAIGTGGRTSTVPIFVSVHRGNISASHCK